MHLKLHVNKVPINLFTFQRVIKWKESVYLNAVFGKRILTMKDFLMHELFN